jgi:hypothetical protein
MPWKWPCAKYWMKRKRPHLFSLARHLPHCLMPSYTSESKYRTPAKGVVTTLKTRNPYPVFSKRNWRATALCKCTVQHGILRCSVRYRTVPRITPRDNSTHCASSENCKAADTYWYHPIGLIYHRKRVRMHVLRYTYALHTSAIALINCSHKEVDGATHVLRGRNL